MSITEALDEAPHIVPFSTGMKQKFPQDIDLCQSPTSGDLSEITVDNCADCAEYDPNHHPSSSDDKLGNQQSVQQSTSSYRNLKRTCIPHERSIVSNDTTTTTQCDEPPPLPDIDAPESMTRECVQTSKVASNTKRADTRIRSMSSFSSSQFSLRRRTSTMDSGCQSQPSQHDQQQQPTTLLLQPVHQDSLRRLLGDRRRRSVRPWSSSGSSSQHTPTPEILIGAIVGESDIIDLNHKEEKWNETEITRLSTSKTAKQKFQMAGRVVKDVVRCVQYTLIQPWKQRVVRPKPEDEVTLSRAKGRLA
jgi:hypothetical protein